jgi:hypothetical protein
MKQPDFQNHYSKQVCNIYWGMFLVCKHTDLLHIDHMLRSGLH